MPVAPPGPLPSDKLFFSTDEEQEAENWCCRWNDKPSFCAQYQLRRPRISCVRYRPPRPAWTFGDPHITTLDNAKYTFNGLGDFLLVQAQDRHSSFLLEGRTAQTSSANATNFIAFAAQYNTSSLKSPITTEDLEPHQGPTEGTRDWSSEEPEEEQEETGAGPAGYSYQSLHQDPEQEEVGLAPVGEGEDGAADIQDRIQALGLHLPDPPLKSEDEDEEGAVALSSHSSIPVDPAHMELVKRTMAGVILPEPGVPTWARETSDAQWEDVVQKALQARQASPAWK